MRERRNYLAPSLLAADFKKLQEQISIADKAGAAYFHLDVMDGMFVPSISFGLPVISSIRSCTDKIFDVHLMIEEPSRYIEDFSKAGADIITVHAEACSHLDRTVKQIKSMGKRACVALNPATSLSVLDYVLPNLDMVLVMTVNPGFGGQELIPYCLEKIERLYSIINNRGLTIDIEVDGGVCAENIQSVLKAGANVIVSGSDVFTGDINVNINRLLKYME